MSLFDDDEETSMHDDVQSQKNSTSSDSVHILGQEFKNPLFYFKTNKGVAIKKQIARWCNKSAKSMKTVYLKVFALPDGQKTMRFISADEMTLQAINGSFAPSVWEISYLLKDTERIFSFESEKLLNLLSSVDMNREEFHWVAQQNGKHTLIIPKGSRTFDCEGSFVDQKVNKDQTIYDMQGVELQDVPTLNSELPVEDLVEALSFLQKSSDDLNILNIEASKKAFKFRSGTSTLNRPLENNNLIWDFQEETLDLYFNMMLVSQNTSWICNSSDRDLCLSIMQNMEEVPNDRGDMIRKIRFILLFRQNLSFAEAGAANKGSTEEVRNQGFSSTLSFLMNRDKPSEN